MTSFLIELTPGRNHIVSQELNYALYCNYCIVKEKSQNRYFI